MKTHKEYVRIGDEMPYAGIVVYMTPVTEIGEGVYVSNSFKKNVLMILWLN